MINTIITKEYFQEWHDTIEGILQRKRRNSKITLAKTNLGMPHLPKPANFTRSPANVFIEDFYPPKYFHDSVNT